MNRTEQEHADLLTAMKNAGDIRSFRFESVKLVLARKTGGKKGVTYTPDFLVVLNDGTIRFDEIKGGHIRDDAMLKLRMAAELFPMFKWALWQKKKGQWTVTELGGEA